MPQYTLPRFIDTTTFKRICGIGFVSVIIKSDMALWDKISSRGNVEDRRDSSGIAIGGSAGALGLILVIALSFFGGGNIDPSSLQEVLNQFEGSGTVSNTSDYAGEDAYEVFASKVVGSADDYWLNEFSVLGQTYKKPTLVLFRQATRSGCGYATSASGPHYCPADQTIYLDETFFDELKNQLGGSNGDVAQAYVITHEVGHHIQNLLGALEGISDSQSSIKAELQADCYAGLWAHSLSSEGVISQEEITQALSAASAVGDDRIQEKTTGRVEPENWTHGSSEQRVNAFNSGYQTGKFTSCDNL